MRHIKRNLKEGRKIKCKHMEFLTLNDVDDVLAKNIDINAIWGSFIKFFLQKRLSELSLIFLFSVALSQNPENVFSFFKRAIEIISH